MKLEIDWGAYNTPTIKHYYLMKLEIDLGPTILQVENSFIYPKV